MAIYENPMDQVKGVIGSMLAEKHITQRDTIMNSKVLNKKQKQKMLNELGDQVYRDLKAIMGI